jgi:hypothetical protein
VLRCSFRLPILAREGHRWAKMRTNRILTDKLAEFGASSKLNAELLFLQMLKAEGRTTAEDFQSPMDRMWESARPRISTFFWRNADHESS